MKKRDHVGRRKNETNYTETWEPASIKQMTLKVLCNRQEPKSFFQEIAAFSPQEIESETLPELEGGTCQLCQDSQTLADAMLMSSRWSGVLCAYLFS